MGVLRSEPDPPNILRSNPILYRVDPPASRRPANTRAILAKRACPRPLLVWLVGSDAGGGNRNADAVDPRDKTVAARAAFADQDWHGRDETNHRQSNAIPICRHCTTTDSTASVPFPSGTQPDGHRHGLDEPPCRQHSWMRSHYIRHKLRCLGMF